MPAIEVRNWIPYEQDVCRNSGGAFAPMSWGKGHRIAREKTSARREQGRYTTVSHGKLTLPFGADLHIRASEIPANGLDAEWEYQYLAPITPKGEVAGFERVL